MKNALAKGFTLIELMIVVAIIGILAAVVASACNDHIDNANMEKVSSHYEEAARFAENEMRRLQDEIAIGRTTSAQAQTGVLAVMTRLNQSGALAPDGSVPAYQTSAGATSGAVGVNATGTVAGNNLQVVVTRPAYQQLTTRSRTVAWNAL